MSWSRPAQPGSPGFRSLKIKGGSCDHQVAFHDERAGGRPGMGAGSITGPQHQQELRNLISV